MSLLRAKSRDNEDTANPAGQHLADQGEPPLSGVSSQFLSSEDKVPAGRAALGDWLGPSRVRLEPAFSPNLGSRSLLAADPGRFGERLQWGSVSSGHDLGSGLNLVVGGPGESLAIDRDVYWVEDALDGGLTGKSELSFTQSQLSP